MRPLLALVLMVSSPQVVDAQRDLYVDASLASDCADYDAGDRSCGGGGELGYATIAASISDLRAGDTVWLRAGTYEERIIVAVSGTAVAPIVFRGYTDEEAVIANLSDPALFVDAASYVRFEAFTVRDVLGWGRLEDADHIVVRDMTFERATGRGTTGSLKLVRTTQSRIEGNVFSEGNDNLMVQESDRNLIVNNVFESGRHSLLSVRCGDANVFRGNRFSNEIQKAMEIYDCEGVSDAPVEYDATHRNLIEGNHFLLTLGSDAPHRYNGIQYAGQDGIVRRNVFYDNAGGGFHIQVYADEALVNYGHRVYHNTLVDNRCYGIIASEDARDSYADNIVQSNLLFGNVGCDDETAQSWIRNDTAVLYRDNLEATEDPGFVDRAGRDLRLLEGGAAVDAATFLTVAVGAGSGTTLVVADARYFFDGGGVEGEVGDLIQLAGETERRRVVGVDIASGILTLDGSLEWDDGQGVTLSYEGEAPDVGAFELGAVSPPPVDGGLARPDGGGLMLDSSLPDGGTTNDGGGSGGCGCRTVGSPREASGAPAVALLGLVLTRRRRRGGLRGRRWMSHAIPLRAPSR